MLKKAENKQELGIGDIIIFENGNLLIIHRIVRIENDMYWTRADNWDNMIKRTNGEIVFDDAPVAFDKIQWKVVGIIYQ